MTRNVQPPPEPEENDDEQLWQKRAPEAPGGGNVPRSRASGEDYTDYDRDQHGQWFSEDTTTEPDGLSRGY